MTDFKTSDRDVNRAIRSWLHEDRHEDASRIAGAVLDRVEATPERRAGWPARRTPTMNRFMTFGLGAAAVVVIGLLLGAQLLGEPSNTGGQGEATPTLETRSNPTATSEPTAAVTPKPTPSPVAAPPLTRTFTSTQHGISMSYPEGWTAKAATEPWTDMSVSDFRKSVFDFLYHPITEDGLFLSMASQPIGDVTADEWMAAALGSIEGCTAAEPIEVDGASARIVGEAEGCPADIAVVTRAGRGYWIELYGNDPEFAPYDRAWFEEVLATVQLHPEDAVD